MPKSTTYLLYPGPEDDGIQRSISQKERDEISESDFAWPSEKKYPIRSQEELDAAAKLIGRAPEANQEAIKTRAMSIAKRKGFTLPDTWMKDEKDSEERSAEPVSETVAMPDHAYLFAPITRIDKDKWEVEGVATSEEVDSFGTVFSYEASKRAFEYWGKKNANVREMHERKAVGKGIEYRFDDANRQVIVRSKVSRGAPDTWQKVLDDVLCGYSVGAAKPKWETIERNGKTYPYLVDYELVELSLVDSPSNPACNITFARADGLTDIVETAEPQGEQIAPSVASIVDPEIERKGAKISADTRKSMHESRDHQMNGAMKTMDMCGCDECSKMHKAIDPDMDGDNDLVEGSEADTDHDAEQLAERVVSIVETRLHELLNSPIMRLNAISGIFARSHQSEIDLSPIQGSIQTLSEQLRDVAPKSSLDEVRSAVAEVRGLVDRIAAQPASGGPILNATALDRRFQTPHSSSEVSEEEMERRILERLANQGKLSTHELQTAAAATTLKRM